MPLSLEEIRRREEEKEEPKSAFGDFLEKNRSSFPNSTKKGGINTNAPLAKGKGRAFSKDELKGQRQRKRFVQARKSGEDTTGMRPSFMGNPLERGKKFYTEGDDGRELTRITKKDNPFNVNKLKDFDPAAYGRGSQRDKEILNVNDVRGLKKIGGFDFAEIEKSANKRGIRISNHAQNLLDRKLGRVEKPDKDPITEDKGNRGSKEKAERFKDMYKEKIKNDIKAGDIGSTTGTADVDYKNTISGNTLSGGSSINIDSSVDNTTLGGDTRVFIGSGGSTGGKRGKKDFFNSDYSDAVMAGFDDVNDSPAAAGRDFMMATMFNKKYQDKLRKEREFNKPNYAGQAAASNMFDEEEMANQLNRRKQNSFDLAAIKQAELFGDPGLDMPTSSYTLPRKRDMPELSFM